MAKRTIKISEEQDRLLREMIGEDVSEMLSPNAGPANGGKAVNVSATDNGRPLSITDVYNNYTKNMNSTDAASITTTGSLPGTNGNVVGSFTVKNTKNGSYSGGMYEGVLVKKSQIDRARLEKLKENSVVVKRKDFIG